MPLSQRTLVFNYFVEGRASRRSKGQLTFSSGAVHKQDGDSVTGGGRCKVSSAECKSSNDDSDEDKVGGLTVFVDDGFPPLKLNDRPNDVPSMAKPDKCSCLTLYRQIQVTSRLGHFCHLTCVLQEAPPTLKTGIRIFDLPHRKSSAKGSDVLCMCTMLCVNCK